jgi:hypothetical protein
MKIFYGLPMPIIAALLETGTRRPGQFRCHERTAYLDKRAPAATPVSQTPGGYMKSPCSLAILAIAALLATAPWLLGQSAPNARMRMASERLETYATSAPPSANREETRADLAAQLETLHSPNPVRRAEAVQTLGFGDDSVAAAAVARALHQDPHPQVRAAAAKALTTHNDSVEAIEALVYALRDTDTSVREQALLALSAIRNERVEHELRATLADRILGEETAKAVRSFLNRYYPKS